MAFFHYAVPVLSIAGFAGAAFTVFTGILDPGKMGVSRSVLRMFGIGEVFMAICWAAILIGVRAGSSWPRPLAFFVTGMYLCNYLNSLSMFKNMRDKLFKHWGTATAIILVLYCVRL